VGLVRLFLAMVVAVGHGQLMLFEDITFSHASNAMYAVLFFYAISGFLITYTLSRNYEVSMRGTVQFYTNRFIRIFSLFWPVFAFVLWYNVHARHTFLDLKPIVDQWTSLFLFGVDWNWSFGQAGGRYDGAVLNFLQPSWSLGAELTFYLLVPLFMRRWKLAVAVLVASLALRAFFAMSGWDASVWNYTFFPSTVVFFLLGHFAMKAGDRWPIVASPRIGITLVVLSLGALTVLPYGAFDDYRLWTSMLLFAAGLPGLFNGTKNSRILNWLGELSFPLYLIHFFIIMHFHTQFVSLAGRIVDGKVPTAFVAMAIYLLVSFAASIVAHYILEKPVSWAMHMIARWALRPSTRLSKNITALKTP
jgi:peptidoglycan/LPS O-acetylase OafA/YrhL